MPNIQIGIANSNYCYYIDILMINILMYTYHYSTLHNNRMLYNHIFFNDDISVNLYNAKYRKITATHRIMTFRSWTLTWTLG